MKRLIVLALVLLFVTIGSSQPSATVVSTQVRVYFSPDGGCTDAIVETIGKASSSIWIQAYSFTSAPIAKALVEAHKRGVNVRVILDKSQKTERYSSAVFLHNALVPTSIDGKHAIAHQGHGDRRSDCHHRLVQLHQGGRGKQC